MWYKFEEAVEARFHPVGFVSLLIPSTSLLRTIFLANAPQIFVSLFYLIYNALFTSMFLSKKMDVIWCTQLYCVLQY